MADGSPKPGLTPDLGPAFPALYQQHAGMVRRALRQLGVAPGSLDDAVQDVFVVLHRRIDCFERDRSLVNWLWGIARGVASGYRRGERRRDRLHAALPAPEEPGLPERGVARREAAAILDEFLGSLDADKCAVFVLSEIEGRRGPEIAQQLQVNLNTVYARLRAARQRFDDAMLDHREPARRPLFAAWLGGAWPAWLGKPAAAVGVAAIAVVVAGPGAVASGSATPAATEIVEAGPALAVAEAPGRSHWPRSLVPHAVAPELEAAVEGSDEIVLLDDEPVPARPRSRLASPAGSISVAASIEPVEVTEPELVMGPPARAPWSATVEGRRPVRHPTLLSLRDDFVAELWRIATGM